MWTHYCSEEHCQLDVGEGEECSWCGETEQSQQLSTLVLYLVSEHDKEN